MRHAVFACVLVVLVAHVAVGQEWVEFASAEDGFKIVFPSQPQVRTTTYASQYGYTLPARVYTSASGPQRFSVTVVDYRGIQQQALARACPKGPDTCPRGALTPVIGEGQWRNDVRGAITFALNRFTQRDARITSILGESQDLVEATMVQLTNADRSRTFASISMHDNRLYIVEGTAPAVGYPPPTAFHQALGFVDPQGNGIRYQRIYSNAYHGMGEYPAPPRAGQGGGGAPAQQQQQPAQAPAR